MLLGYQSRVVLKNVLASILAQLRAGLAGDDVADRP
jgi:hypothetical protein